MKNNLIKVLEIKAYKNLSVGFFIILGLIILFILNFNKIIKTIIDNYFLSLIELFHEKRISSSLVNFALLFGSFTGRRISRYFKFPISLVFITIGTSCYLSFYILIIDSFLLGVYFKKLSIVKYVFNCLYSVASPEVQKKFRQ